MSTRTYDICIIGGLGHVGLPLGIAFATAGMDVCLIDIDLRAVDIVSKGKMPFMDAGAEEALRQVIHHKLFISTDKSVVSQCKFILITIGTPIDEHLNPIYDVLKNTVNEIIHIIRDDQHIILRSTVYPGTTKKMKKYLEENGKQTRLSFCPERVAQGKVLEEIRSLPQIVSSFDKDAIEEVRNLFLRLTKDIIVLEPMEAELAKLYTNVWRYIQFSIANQFYQIAAMNQLDFYRIYNAITYKYPRAQNFPTAGFAAGPCLFKDTMQLAAFSNNNFFLGHAAMLINEGLPNVIVQMLNEKYGLHDKTVGILGMAFKADNDDKRESLSYKLKKILKIEAKSVCCSDVYINDPGFVSTENLIADSDIIILGAPHREYLNLSFKPDQVVVDIWNFYGKGGKI